MHIVVVWSDSKKEPLFIKSRKQYIDRIKHGTNITEVAWILADGIAMGPFASYLFHTQAWKNLPKE